MNLKIAIVEDNSFLVKAVIEKLSFFNDLNYKFKGVNGGAPMTPSIVLL
ncbi:hypothetical protein [Lutibacter sp.]